MPYKLALIAIVALGAYIAFKKLFRSHIVYEYQKGLLYKKGRLARVLDAGKYWIFAPSDWLTVIDVRSQTLVVASQEVLLADNIQVKVSVAGTYKIEDVALALHGSNSYLMTVHHLVQMIVRELVPDKTMETFIKERNELSKIMYEKLAPKMAELGLSLESVAIRDITLSAELRKAYNQTIAAERTAAANLTRARSEVAALRALANAARMIDSNPALLNLRTLQTVSEVAAHGGNTIVFNADRGNTAELAGRKAAKAPPDSESGEDQSE